MRLRDFILYCAAGLGLQVLLIMKLTWLGMQEITATIYWPFLLLGEHIFPSGPGGHAMSAAANFGLLVGVFVYSLLIGGATYLVKRAFAAEGEVT